MSFYRIITFHRGQTHLRINIKPSYGDDDNYRGSAEATFELLSSGEKRSGSCWLDEGEMNAFLWDLLLLRNEEGVAKLTCALSPEFHITITPTAAEDTFFIKGEMAEFSYLGEYCFPHPHSFAFEIHRNQLGRAADVLSSIPRKRPPEPEIDFSSWIAGL
jgi:hypothetical protein